MDSASRQPRNLTDLLAALHPDLLCYGIRTGGAWPTVTMLVGTDPTLLIARLDTEATLHLGMDRKAQAAVVMGRAARATDAADPSRMIGEQWLITRGGCCRWYTCAQGDHCSVRVLRPAGEQQAAVG